MPPPKDPKKYAEWLRKNRESHLGKPSAFRGKHHTQEAKDKNRAKHLGIGKSEETRKLMSIAHQGQTPWNSGKTGVYSEERLKQIQEQMLGNKHAQGSKHTEEWKKWKSESQSGERNQFCGKAHSEEFRLMISKLNTGKTSPMKGKNHSEETKARLKITRMHQVFPRVDSKPERMMQIALSLRGIKYEKHKPIYGQPDIFIEPNICIFVDGDYWHNRPEVQARDLEVNDTLEKQKYHVIRIWEKDVKQDVNKAVDLILNKILELA